MSDSPLASAVAEVVKVLRKYHFTYNQTKDLMKGVRRDLELKPDRSRRGTVNRLTSEEQERFIAQAYKIIGTRGLMLTVLLETGCRVTEFCNLRTDDLSCMERLITIRHGKGDKRREIPIREDLARMLQIHLSGRDAGYLFETRLHSKFSIRRMQQIVNETAADAGIPKRVYPHLLRHSIATRLTNAGMPIELIQQFLGHEDISTTRIYAKTETSTMRRGFDAAMRG